VNYGVQSELSLSVGLYDDSESVASIVLCDEDVIELDEHKSIISTVKGDKDVGAFCIVPVEFSLVVVIGMVDDELIFCRCCRHCCH